MTPDSTEERDRRVPWAAWLAAIALALPLAYLGSFAPAWRFVQPSRYSSFHRFYGPAFFVMERTPLRAPLLAWCATWGVRDRVERQLERREMQGIFDTPASSSHLE